MKILVLLNAIVTTAALTVFAGNAAIAQGDVVTAELAKWGERIDPDGDCKFFVADGTLLITVPGSARPHDLAADVETTNAPRVVKPVQGEFTLQVQVDGRFMPGPESTLPGRLGYNGAGLVVVLDSNNVVTLARAVIHKPGRNPEHYINFEIRVGGKLQRIGHTSDHPIPDSGPVFLRLERRDQKILGAVSADGTHWTALGSKDVPEKWNGELNVGVVAISSSKLEFNPRFSQLQILK